MTALPSTYEIDYSPLKTRLAGDVALPGDADWDEARQAWNLAVDQRPAAVALPESADDVVEIVRFARERGLRVAAQGTGHNAMPLRELEQTILVKTHRMRAVAVDPDASTVWAQAGALWMDVTSAAAEHGLAALAGSSPDVGVVGYSLGGGISWLARKHGLATNSIVSIELVNADGKLIRADAKQNADLFWALRGGGGSFGVVTAIELRLFPISEVYAGILWFPVERAREALRAWRAWTDDVPEEMTSVGRILQLPPIPQIPEPVRGKSFVVVEAIFLGDEEAGSALLAPLRALGPVMDTVATIPMTALSHLHMDPEEPVPGKGDGGMLTEVDDETIDALVANTVGTPLLSVELRHLGGAVARASADHGALAAFDAPYVMFAVGMTPTPGLGAAVGASIDALREALSPWEAEHTYMNFAEGRRSEASLFSQHAYRRLRRIKAAYDAADVIRSNHPITPS